MKRIAIEDLPKWSPWPARLLGLSPWTAPSRTLDKVIREYDQDKYGRCLDFCEARGGSATPEEVRKFELGDDGARRICVSMGNDLFEFGVEEAATHYENLLAETLDPELKEAGTLVELGAGYGYNLWALRKKFTHLRFVGGELSANAVAVAERLYREEDGLTVRPFNFYDPDSYALVSHAKSPIVVFTSYAIEQLTRSAPFLDGLRSCRQKVRSVVHFESVYESGDDKLLTLLRRRYTEINDYNKDLISELSSQSDITISSCRKNVFGQNPLHAISVIQWRFI